MKFYVGKKVNVLVGKYKGQNVHITEIHISFKPIQYSCEASNGKILLLGENEIQSMYQRDKEMVGIWKEIKGGS